MPSSGLLKAPKGEQFRSPVAKTLATNDRKNYDSSSAPPRTSHNWLSVARMKAVLRRMIRRVSFNSSLKVDFQGSRATSDGGLVLVRELDERLGFRELIERHLADSRGKNSQLHRRLAAAVRYIASW